MTSSQRSHAVDPARPVTGILTKTLLRSPVIRWIFGARLGDSLTKHVVCIGQDFVHIQELDGHGHLHHVVTKKDFNTAIRSARIIGKIDELHDFDVSIKLEVSDDTSKDRRPQMIILCLESDEILFLSLQTLPNNRHSLRCQSYPLPRFDRILYQPGQQLAVEPLGRAFAVAAAERHFVLYALHERPESNSQPEFPSFVQRVLAVDGVITHVEFLLPPGEDPRHIILLLLVADGKKIKATWLDWYFGNDIYHAQLYPSQPLESTVSVPSLLIPLRDAAFIVVQGDELVHWKHLTSGSPNAARLEIARVEPLHPGTSPRRPQWVSWCRPQQRQAQKQDGDSFYLAREDGLVCLLQVWDDRRVQTSLVTNIDCLVGTAFSSIGALFGTDILIAAGEMCTGRLIAITQPDMNRETGTTVNIDTADLDLIETLPNWTSVVDLIATDLPHSQKSTRTREGIFVTSGRQPHGSVTELRSGLAAQLLLFLHLPGLVSATGAWVLPLATTRSFLVLITGTSSTKLFEIGSDYESFSEIDAADAPAFDLDGRTLSAIVTSHGNAFQITEQSVRFVTDPADISENVVWSCNEDESILVSATDAGHSLICLGARCGTEFRLHLLRVLETDEQGESSSSNVSVLLSVDVSAEPLAVVILKIPHGHLLAVSTADCRVQILALSSNVTLKHTADIAVLASDEGTPACDALNFLCVPGAARSLLVCGLRDGHVLSRIVDTVGTPGQLCGEQHVVALGKTTVRQTAWTVNTLCAMSGAETCRVTWDGSSAAPTIESIWLVDKLRPELAQEAATACAVIPQVNWLSSGGGNPLANALMLIVGDQLTFAQVLPTVTTVPRQIAVGGTPTRLIYMEQQRCLVCASLRSDVRGAPPNARRQLYPVLDFIPTRSHASSYMHEMPAGARVYALLEWSITLSEDKVYSYLLVGGSYIRKQGVERGLVTMLQPTNRRWKVVDVNEGPTTKFNEPVYALSLWNDKTYIACSGRSVHVQRFDPELKRWFVVGDPFQLSSPGTQVTVVDGLIHISTATDSLVTLQLCEPDTGPAALVPVRQAPKAAASLSHAVVNVGHTADSMVLLSTKYGQLLGMPVDAADRDPSLPIRSQPRAAQIAFEIQLPRSLTRIRRARVSPSWRPSQPPGVLTADIIGACADGTLMGLALLDEQTWRRLFWLQRLCEWDAQQASTAADPMVTVRSRRAAYFGDDEGLVHDSHARGFWPGLGEAVDRSGAASTVMLRTSFDATRDAHVDGDVLGRLWEDDVDEPTSAVQNILRRMAAHAATAKHLGQEDRMCAWVAANMDSELGHAEAVIHHVRTILSGWI